MSLDTVLQAYVHQVEAGNPIAIVGAVWLLERTVVWGKEIKARTNGGTHERKVERKLDRIGDQGAAHALALHELREQTRLDVHEARRLHESGTEAIRTLSSAVDKNVGAVENQTRVVEELVRAFFGRQH